MEFLISCSVALSITALYCTSGAESRPPRDSPPDEGLIIGGHSMVGRESQTLRTGEAVHFLEVPYTALGIAATQELVERRVAIARIASGVTEGAVNAEHTSRIEHVSDASEEILH